MLTFRPKDLLNVDYIIFRFNTRHSDHVHTLLYRVVENLNVVGTQDREVQILGPIQPWYVDGLVFLDLPIVLHSADDQNLLFLKERVAEIQKVS